MKIYLFHIFLLIFLSSFYTDLPKFGEPLQNITIAVGREALLICVVDNLQTYKVIEIIWPHVYIYLRFW